MTSIRKFIYVSLLALTTISFVPSLAMAQAPANGSFTLAHEVHWQNAVVPAGDYKFKYELNGASSVLVLSKLSGARTAYLFLVRDTEELKSTGVNQLVLASTAEGKYVSAMKLPEFGITLHFRVPTEAVAKRMAPAGTTVAAVR
jgi:hypothetical protein